MPDVSTKIRQADNFLMQIFTVTNDEIMIRKVAEVLIDGFSTSGVNPWENLQSAIGEVRESLAENRISRVCVDESGEVLGWIGGFHEYAFLLELHPLVVRSDRQNIRCRNNFGERFRATGKNARRRNDQTRNG